MVATNIICVLVLLVNLACVRANLPDLSKICEESESCDMSVRNVNGSTFSNFKVVSECVDCLNANIGDDNAAVSCKVSGCYSDGKDYELARFAKDSQVRNILDKPICANPTAKNIEKLAIICKVEHKSKEPVELTTFKMEASPKMLLDSERLCMNFSFSESPTPSGSTQYKIRIEPLLRPDCNTNADKMVMFEFRN